MQTTFQIFPEPEQGRLRRDFIPDSKRKAKLIQLIVNTTSGHENNLHLKKQNTEKRPEKKS